MEKYKYEFRCGFDTIEEGEREMRYIRMRGKELAEEKGMNVTHILYNSYTSKWENLGSSTPDGFFFDWRGKKNVLDEDGRNYTQVKED